MKRVVIQNSGALSTTVYEFLSAGFVRNYEHRFISGVAISSEIGGLGKIDFEPSEEKKILFSCDDRVTITDKGEDPKI